MTQYTSHRWFASVTYALLIALPGAAAAAGEHDGGHGPDGGDGHQQQEHRNDEHGMAAEGHHDGNKHGEGHDGGNHGHAHGDGGHSADFGRPASADEADRTVRITASDSMRFDPERVRVEAGETVRFVVENPGAIQHSFKLGTPGAQRRHSKAMRGMAIDRMAGHMRNDQTGMVIQPGDTGRLTWHFSQSGRVQFACHIPGHYDAGMKGRIRIE